MFGTILPNLVIGLREGLEATLIVTILVAYLVKIERRDRLPQVALGVGLAVALSLAFGAALTFTAASMSTTAQEAFGGSLSLLAVSFVTWMVFWMRRTARSLSGELRGRLDTALAVGAGAVALTAFLAVGREGLETALFLWSATQSTGGSGVGPFIGAVLGLGAAVTLGWLLYRRAVKLNLSRFFTWTGLGLIIVAAGVAGYGVHDLQEGGVLPGIGAVAFDISRQLPAASWYGSLVKGVLNISPVMTWAQVAAYAAYLLIVLPLFLRGQRAVPTSAAVPTAAAPREPASWRTRLTSIPALMTAGIVLLGGGGIAGATLAGATKPGTTDTPRVLAAGKTCRYDGPALQAGTRTLRVQNQGTDVTELYLYAGTAVVAELENVSPGTARDLTVDLAAGEHALVCKPGMTGAGIRTALTVVAGPAAGGSATPATDPRLTAAVANYRAYVLRQVESLQAATALLATSLRAGDVATAKARYAAARVFYERIEPVAESFPDLDRSLDARAGDVPAASWTGFHVIERDLWQRDTAPPAAITAKLVADVATLKGRIPTLRLTAPQLGNGAAALLNEVATGKVTGEEERYSRLDLVDFAANVEGAHAAYLPLRPVLAQRDAALATTIDARFAGLERGLARYRHGSGYVRYDALTPADVRTLSDAVDGLAAPLSKVTAAVTAPPHG